MSGDRLSDLSDDLLRHILSFAPAKEAASTSALARRWRSVWCLSGSVNLQWCSFMVESFCDMRHVFQGEAIAALNAQAPPVRKLTLHVEGQEESDVSFMHHDLAWESLREIMQAIGLVISSPATRCLEELRIRVCDEYRFNLEIASLPTATLRVLHLGNWTSNWMTNYSQLRALRLPRLEELRLDDCFLGPWPGDLQGLIDAAPLLASLLLYTAHLIMHNDGSSSAPCGRIRCPKVTTLAVADCKFNCWETPRSQCLLPVEVDAPMLQRHIFKGLVQPFTIL